MAELGSILFAGTNTGLYKYDDSLTQGSGTLTSGYILKPIAIDPVNEYIYTGYSDNAEIVQLDYNLNQQWAYTFSDATYMKYVGVIDGHPYFIPDTSAAPLVSLNRSDGSQRFSHTYTRPARGFTYDGTDLWVCAQYGEVYQTDTADGSLINSYDTGDDWQEDIAYHSASDSFYFSGDDYNDTSVFMSKHSDVTTTSADWTVSYAQSTYGSGKTLRIDREGNAYTGENALIKVDSTGAEQWTAFTGSTYDSMYGYQSVHPDGGVYTATRSNDEILKLDAADGTILQTNSLSGPRAVNAYPRYDLHPSLWATTISGSATLNGGAADGAKIFVTDGVNDKLLTTTTADSNGDWSANVSMSVSEVHVSAQYTDGNGNTYNANSLPYVQL
jgi:hypothetical protein